MRAICGTCISVGFALVVGACASGSGDGLPDSFSQGGEDAGGGDASSPSTPPSGSDTGAPSSPPPGNDAGASSNPPPGDDAGSPSNPPPGSDASSPSGPAPGGDSGAPAGTSPDIGGCAVFPANSPWNTRIDGYPVSAMSATYIANMATTTHLHPDWGDWSTDHYGIPWQVVPASQAMVPMTFQYADQSDPGPYPFPANALVEGGSGSGGDMHVLVIDQGTCTLYETYSSTYVGPGWSCGSGAVFPLGSNALRPDGWTSSDAAGLPVLPGLVKVSEVMAGSIQHALRFTMSSTQQAYIHPATHATGSSNANLPPMGLRVRLKASFDLSSFSGPALVILTAMKEYGMLLADNGSNWYVSGDSDDAWTPLMDGIITAFDGVTGTDFEVVDTGPLSTAGL